MDKPSLDDDYEDVLPASERINALDQTVAKVRREMSVASLEYLAVLTIGSPAQYVVVKRRLQTLQEIVDAAVREIERLLVEQATLHTTNGLPHRLTGRPYLRERRVWNRWGDDTARAR
jgi:hypothetical protein